jgi:uncharacterized protein YjiK
MIAKDCPRGSRLPEIAMLTVALAVSAESVAGLQTIDLATYTHTATYDLSTTRSLEASAVTWNADTDTLFVVGDGPQALAQYSKNGVLLDYMTMTNFPPSDSEGLTWIGGNQFVLALETGYDAKLMTYVAGGTVSGTTLPTASLFSTTDAAAGLEGVAVDPSTGRYWFIEEKTPVAIYEVSLDFSPPPQATVHSTLVLSIPGVTDISDIAALSTVFEPGSPDYSNLLVLSHEGHRLLELNRTTGAVLSQISLNGIVGQVQPEGVAIDSAGVIYIVDEGPSGTQPKLFVLSPPAVAGDDGPIVVTSGVPFVIPVGANDTGFANPATVSVTNPPVKGTISAISPPGPAAGMTVTYTAGAGTSGADSFVYQMADGSPRSDQATVSIIISPDTDGDGTADETDNCTLVSNASQCDADGDGYGNRCDADLNNNGSTNAQDTTLFRQQLGQPSVGPTFNKADLNCNGAVNAQDTTLLRQMLGLPPGPSGLP